MKRGLPFLVGLSAALFMSCQRDQYELKEDKRGRTLRLNKQTGEVVIIGEDRVQALKGPGAELLEQEENQKLHKVKPWPEIAVPFKTKTKATLKTRWIDGTMLYRFHLTPYPEPYPRVLTLELYDDEGFNRLKDDAREEWGQVFRIH